MMLVWGLPGWAADEPVPPPPPELEFQLERPSGLLRELDHPSYVDEAGAFVPWEDVRAFAAHTEAVDLVQRRRNGRAALRVGLALATVVEAWGTVELARTENLVAIPLGVQTGFTGLCSVLAWARIPEDRRRDRAIVLDGANAWLRTTPE